MEVNPKPNQTTYDKQQYEKGNRPFRCELLFHSVKFYRCYKYKIELTLWKYDKNHKIRQFECDAREWRMHTHGHKLLIVSPDPELDDPCCIIVSTDSKVILTFDN